MKIAVFWVEAIALMMEAARTSETLVNFYQTTRCYNPEDSNLHTHHRENLKSILETCYSFIYLSWVLYTEDWHWFFFGPQSNILSLMALHRHTDFILISRNLLLSPFSHLYLTNFVLFFTSSFIQVFSNILQFYNVTTFYHSLMNCLITNSY
jgi:hypothetical protein